MIAVDVDGPVAFFREAAARRAVLVRYATAYDSFVRASRRYIEQRNYIAAAGMWAFAETVRRAYECELNDPEPKA